MSEKMVLIPYSEYQELINRPEDYKAQKMLESVKQLQYMVSRLGTITGNTVYDPKRMETIQVTLMQSTEVMALINAAVEDAERIMGE